MINYNANKCCDNYNQKTIFSSDEYKWKICDNCDLIYQLSNNDKFKKVRETHFNNYKEAGEKGKNELRYPSLKNLINLRPVNIV